jgi:hypothetical protein
MEFVIEERMYNGIVRKGGKVFGCHDKISKEYQPCAECWYEDHGCPILKYYAGGHFPIEVR